MSDRREEFQGWLERGLGRAVIYLQQHDSGPFREAILNACIHDLAHYHQSEGNKAQFIFDVIRATGDKDFYATKIREALATTDDTDSRWQLYDLAGLLAKNGDTLARAVMYETFARHTEEGNFTGADALIETDGMEGFLFVVRQLALHPLPQDEQWLEETYVDTLEEQIGKEEAQAALRQAAQTDPALQAFAERVQQEREADAEARKQRQKFVVPSLAEMQERLAQPPAKNRLLFRRWGRYADESALRVLAYDAPTEDEPERLRNWLALFYWRPYPLAPDVLIRLARSENPDVVNGALDALANVSAPAVRVLGLELLTGPRRSDGAYLLVPNFQPGDYQRFEAAIQQEILPDDLHRLGFAVFRSFEDFPSPDAAAVLTLLYEKDPCSFCRSTAVQHLLSLGPLPDWMIAECRYDADAETRKLVAGVRAVEREQAEE